MNQRIKQKIENAVAADYERTRAAGKEWTLANAKTMACAMYGSDAEPIVHDYFLRLLMQLIACANTGRAKVMKF